MASKKIESFNSRPPKFAKINYVLRKTKVKIDVMHYGLKIWKMIKDRLQKSLSEPIDKKIFILKVRAMKILLCAINVYKFISVSCSDSKK